MSKEVVLIFDIGKTNKKILLFDRGLRIQHEEEVVFEEIRDDDGFACDDIERLESWILEGCRKFLADERFDVCGINFTTYGATLMYIDGEGKRLTPVYNYLKPLPEGIAEELYEAFGGKAEFCRNTASPSLGMLNSGLQARWLQKKKPEIYSKVKTILHFPQYLSHLLTGKSSSEHTSVGCHTGLWNFDKMIYHPWTDELGHTLPDPVSVETTFPSKLFRNEIPVGIGIHDSSSSLVPYFINSDEEFILASTGTWCINMNPFNAEPLSTEQLRQDCLAYMSIQQKPVKSSRFFIGHIHDVNLKRLNQLFGAEDSAYKKVALDENIIESLHMKSGGRKVFFNGGVPEDHLDNTVNKETFDSFEEAYHQLMIDLTELTVASINLIIGKEDRTKNIYISGGFAKNPIFLKLMADSFPGKKVYTSEVANATSMGAALVLWKGLDTGFKADIDLGLKKT
ncbi:MAG: FGGY family carbohydrate kinase [Bacteroidota bacterium]